MDDRVRIAGGDWSAEIALRGAELQSLTDADGRQFLSDGDPAFWSGRAPLLFPVVGRLNGDRYRLGGRDYAMPKHGFARTRDFALVEHTADRAVLRLTDDVVTRAAYPFAFVLDAEFMLAGRTLAMTMRVSNAGDEPMPASFGFHPAFAWPLPGPAARGDHRIVFEHPEPASLAAITADGLIGPHPVTSPVGGDTLLLADDLFAHDALVWRTLNSRRLRYGATAGERLDIAFPDTAMLGIWTRPGARFVCVEPWAGIADPAGYAGTFGDKPGVFTLEPGAERAFRMTVTRV